MEWTFPLTQSDISSDATCEPSQLFLSGSGISRRCGVLRGNRRDMLFTSNPSLEKHVPRIYYVRAGEPTPLGSE